MSPIRLYFEQMTCMGHVMSYSGMMGELGQDDPGIPGPLAASFLNVLGVQLDTAVEVLAENPFEELDQAIREIIFIDRIKYFGCRTFLFNHNIHC